MNVVARTFTKAEAQDLVPVLTELFAEARIIVEELLTCRREGVSASADGTLVSEEDSALRFRRLSGLLQARLQTVTDLGVEVRRVDGLVDIPAWINGEDGFFCWKYGETHISEWHLAHEGCTDRRPLDVSLPVGLH